MDLYPWMDRGGRERAIEGEGKVPSRGDGGFCESVFSGFDAPF